MARRSTSGFRSALPSWPTASIAVFLFALGCSPVTDPPPNASQAPATPKAPGSSRAPAIAGGLTLQNRVWVVERSNAVAQGSARIFLWDGTLVMTGPGSEPAFGRWTFELGRLRIIEEGIAYETEILECVGDRLRLRMLSPGEPVVLELRDARPPEIPPADG